MTKEKFAEILKELDYSDNQVNLLWDAAPKNGVTHEELTEEGVRKVGKIMAPIKDILRQE